MRHARAHPVALTLVALVIASATAAAIATAYGFSPFAHVWLEPHWAWLALALVGALLASAAYAVSYRAVVRARGGPRISWMVAFQAVIRGFAPFAAGGGFFVDKHLLQVIDEDEQAATVRVLGLGALEWALLAPAAWLSAVVLLAVGDPDPMPSLVWPWAVAVPIGFLLGFSLATPRRRQRIDRKGGRWWPRMSRGLQAVEILRFLGRSIPSCWLAWVGMAGYWALDIASLYGALRFVGLRLNLGELIIAYATGYALTRRSLPVGGVGVTEALMTFSLHWVGQPVLPALAAVLVYRVFNLALPAVPALLVRRHMRPLLNAADRGANAGGPERWRPSARARALHH